MSGATGRPGPPELNFVRGATRRLDLRPGVPTTRKTPVGYDWRSKQANSRTPLLPAYAA